MSQSNHSQSSALNNEKTLKAAIKDCMMRDQFRLHRRLQGAARIKNDQAKHAVFDEIAADIAKSMSVVELRRTQRPTVTYPELLPVSQKKDDIAEAIKHNQVVIVAGETGSGKTTQLPKICLELGRGVKGMIGHTQPRRLAARSVASRIAEELECEMGSYVGYKVRFNNKF